MRLVSLWLACLVTGVLGLTFTASAADSRGALAEAVLSDDAARQVQLVQELAASTDPAVITVLTAWRQGTVYIYEANGERQPFLLDSQIDGEGRARGLRVADGKALQGSDGKEVLFLASELTPVDTTSRLRRVMKTTLDLLGLNNPNPKMRRDTVTKLGQEQNQEYLKPIQARMEIETDPEVRQAGLEALAVTQLNSPDPVARLAAVRQLGGMRALNATSALLKLDEACKADPAGYGKETVRAVHEAVIAVQDHQARVNAVGTVFRGLSLAAVLLVAALGLAITFGLMGVINMAHGELIMVGAYSAYVTQNIFRHWFGESGPGFDAYFLVALVTAFFVAGIVGIILERFVIRFLYKRPLESLLATWGVSLVLQQMFRHIFGAANVQVTSPSWLSGSLVINDVLIAYNRLFVIGFAVFIVGLTYALLTRTSLGLQIRAVMQNRSMASALGVRTDRVDMMTFAFGSGLAGMAGACLSQLSNVGPSLGQSYIVDCFMVVVLGGVGNLVGTVVASLGVGVTDQVLQPWVGAVMGKITVLAAIILFLQWRPAGLFATRGRSLEG